MMHVRRWRPGDVIRGLPAVGAGSVDAVPRSSVVVVEEDRRLVAVAGGGPLGSVWRVEALHAAAIDLAPAVAALGATLLPGYQLEVMIFDADPPIDDALRAAGLTRVLEQLRYDVPLAGVGRPARRPFAHASAVGRLGLAAAIAEVWGQSSGPTGRSSIEEADTLLALAGGATTRWSLAFDRTGLVGLLCPTIDPGRPGAGVLHLLGVVPARRGEGVGRALHDEALWRLRDAGATVYEDATEPANLAMRRLLESRGGEITGRNSLFRGLPTGRRAGASHATEAPARRSPLATPTFCLDAPIAVPIMPAEPSANLEFRP